MVIFNSYVKLPEGHDINIINWWNLTMISFKERFPKSSSFLLPALNLFETSRPVNLHVILKSSERPSLGDVCSFHRMMKWMFPKYEYRITLIISIIQFFMAHFMNHRMIGLP